MKHLIPAMLLAAGLPVVSAPQHEGHEYPPLASEEGLGRAHMQTSCLPAVSADFDRALALLHNFWYSRAFDTLQSDCKD